MKLDSPAARGRVHKEVAVQRIADRRRAEEAEAGVAISELVRKHGISRNTYFNRKARYSGAEVSELKRLKELEAENAKLKKMYSDLALENAAIKELLQRKR